VADQIADPVADGEAWAQRQHDAFPAWVAREGGGDRRLWDFGLESLDLLCYAIFDRYPTAEAIDDPDNAPFTDPATWYLGEIARRSNPKKLRWSRRDFGLAAGRYVVEPTAKTQAWAAISPRAHLGVVARSGDPLWLRSLYVDYIAPLWDKPWPAWIHSSETGSWSWDDATQRWSSQRDQWLNGIAGLLTALAAQLPGIALDYSTDSLQAVEAFVVGNPSAAEDATVRSAVVAYLGECLLRSGGGKWIWDENPEHLTNGFPVVVSHTRKASPAHLFEYARVRRDGQTFARVHRAWIADAQDCLARADHQALDREPTPGLDRASEPMDHAEQWAENTRNRFPDWVTRYGSGRRWDFSAASLDALALVIIDQCPAGVYLLDAPVAEDFIGGAVWYFGETLRRAKPSRWCYYDSVAATTGRELTGVAISTNLAFDGPPHGVFLVQELDRVIRSAIWDGAVLPVKDPGWLRGTYRSWVTSSMRERVDQALKRREQVKRRAGRKRSDAETLARWLEARNDGFPGWIEQFGYGTEWDFSVESLDALEALIRQRAAGPEELLEDKSNADFLEGAAWYFGEVLRRHDASGRARWEYERDYYPEPHLQWRITTEVTNQLAMVYSTTEGGGVLRGWYESVGKSRET
jgi:hypothetical protein